MNEIEEEEVKPVAYAVQQGIDHYKDPFEVAKNNSSNDNRVSGYSQREQMESYLNPFEAASKVKTPKVSSGTVHSKRRP